MASPRRTRRLPLEGIRVTDFTWVNSSPYGTLHLALLGAEVIKIEGLQRLDANRDHIPFADTVPGLNRGGQFALLNAAKQSVTLDLTAPRDQAIVKDLVAVSDVVVENMSVGILARYGMGYDCLRRVRPDLVVVACSGFGQGGPLAPYRAFMNTIHGFTGLIDLNGNPGEPPTPLGGNWTDYVAGTAIPFAIMAALHHRERTGQGQFVDLSMSEALMAIMGIPFMEHFINGRNPPRLGNRSQTALQGVYLAKPGRWVAIAIENEAQWQALARLMGRPGWSNDPRFASMSGRLHHQDELDARISEWALAQGLDPWPLAERLQAAGIPAGPMASAADLVDDAHPRLRGFFYEATHPEVGARLYMGLPYHLRADMPYDSSPAPCLGQHNARVLGDLLGCEPALVRELDVQARRRVATYYESLAHGPAPAG